MYRRLVEIVYSSDLDFERLLRHIIKDSIWSLRKGIVLFVKDQKNPTKPIIVIMEGIFVVLVVKPSFEDFIVNVRKNQNVNFAINAKSTIRHGEISVLHVGMPSVYP